MQRKLYDFISTLFLLLLLILYMYISSFLYLSLHRFFFFILYRKVYSGEWELVWQRATLLYYWDNNEYAVCSLDVILWRNKNCNNSRTLPAVDTYLLTYFRYITTLGGSLHLWRYALKFHDYLFLASSRSRSRSSCRFYAGFLSSTAVQHNREQEIAWWTLIFSALA